MQVNGTKQVLEQPRTLLDFLETQGYAVQRVAVERNGEIVPRTAFGTTMLCDSDRIEIVQFMGGG